MTPRPDYPPFQGLPDIPALRLLRDRPQWVAWHYAWKANASNLDGGKWTKPPLDAQTGRGASHTDARTWSPYDQAAAFAADRRLPGVGYVLGPDDDIIGIDLDKCRDPSSGALETWAADIIDLGETYAEVSPSGSGVRLFAQGQIEKAVKSDPAHVEIYASRRYLTVTGRKIEGAPVEVRAAPRTLAALLARVDAVKAEAEAKARPADAKSDSAPRAEQPQRRGPITGQFAEYANRFFRAVNTEAMRNLDRWVSELFGSAAVYQPTTRGYRISSSALGRNLEEDLSITPDGIVDFGVHDLGDARGGDARPRSSSWSTAARRMPERPACGFAAGSASIRRRSGGRGAASLHRAAQRANLHRVKPMAPARATVAGPSASSTASCRRPSTRRRTRPSRPACRSSCGRASWSGPWPTWSRPLTARAPRCRGSGRCAPTRSATCWRA